MAIITISRGTMSGGRAVAECLADRLGYPCVAAEILEKGAAKLGVPVKTVRGKLETPPGLWARLKRDREKYILAVRVALLEACATGELVYHGLAGQFLLKDCQGVLRVRLVAPHEKRMQLLVQEHHMTREAAAEFIHSADQDRRRWVKQMFGADVEALAHYDLTVSLRALSLESACAVIAEAASQPQHEITEDMRARMERLAAGCRTRLEALVKA